MNLQKVRRPAWHMERVETLHGASYRGTASSHGTQFPSGSAYEMPHHPDRRGKGLPPFRLSGGEDPEPVEGDGSRANAGRSRQAAAGRILIVEDDGHLRETLADILQYEGYRVETAGNGQEAWSRLAAEPYPALILLDLMMPVMNGWEFRARQLRDAVLASIPVVVISAAEGVERQSALLSANGFLAKPIDVSLLIDVVSRFVS